MEIMLIRRSILALIGLLMTSSAVQAQAVDEASPQYIVDRARERSAVYLETFKNLLSEERKTFEIFEKDGKVKKRKTVESTFLVYQLSKTEGGVVEFRNVISVDGKRVSDAEGRAREFFEKVVATTNSEKEQDQIHTESSRFDEDFAINGLTLFQAIALSNKFRGKFRFTLAGRESIGGKTVFAVLYEQIRPDPSITVNVPTASDNYDIEVDGDRNADLNARIRGKLFIDADTFNLRRETRERTIQPVGFPAPVVVAEDVLEYTDSSFGILTPKTLSHLQYRVRLKDGSTSKDTKITFDYAKFTQPDVDVKGEVKDKTQ